MTTMAVDCPECGKQMYANQTRCQCGWKGRAIQSLPPREIPGVLRPEMVAELVKVNAYIAKYRETHPNATKREACMAMLRENGLASLLPENLR